MVSWNCVNIHTNEEIHHSKHALRYESDLMQQEQKENYLQKMKYSKKFQKVKIEEKN